ncbi:MAG: DUF4147 domain-containing protein [Candidatus Cloacimonadaceae bacterium]
MDLKETLLELVKQSLQRFSPYNLLYEQLAQLPFNRPIYIFALGTAAYQMTEAVLYHAQQEDFIRVTGGLVITHYGNVKKPLPNIKTVEANHFEPDENSLKAGEAAIEFLQNISETDILLVLLSGGGSNLMEKPAEGFSLDTIKTRVKELIQKSAGIEEIESERKKMSALKGGKLLQYLKVKDIYIYAMSNVPGDAPKYIASNPFHPDAEITIDELAADNFYRFDNLTRDKFVAKDHNIIYKIIANNQAFCDTVRKTAADTIPLLEADLLHVIMTGLSGEAAKNGYEIGNLARLIEKQEGSGIAAFATPCLLIFGGETFVSGGHKATGGSCTELALAAVEGISSLLNCALLAFNTKGRDGFIEGAGAVIDNHSKQALAKQGIKIKEALQKHESYNALKAINAIIPMENTGTSVNEIVLLYIQ